MDTEIGTLTQEQDVTEEELKQIEHRAASVYGIGEEADILALTAEVRKLKARLTDLGKRHCALLELCEAAVNGICAHDGGSPLLAIAEFIEKEKARIHADITRHFIQADQARKAEELKADDTRAKERE